MTKLREYLVSGVRQFIEVHSHLKNFGGPILRFLYLAYPLLVVSAAMILLPKTSNAGVIRKIVLSPEKPGVINLAFGNATAVSFQAKPEKLVPGSPQKVEINFLGKDITISPLGSSPGNLIVYTSGNRYVLLFRIVPEALHDDVVEVVSARTNQSRAIRLDEDSYSVRKIAIALKPKSWKQAPKNVEFEAVAYRDRLVSDDLVDFLGFQTGFRCERCVLRKQANEKTLTCQTPMKFPIQCKSEQFKEIVLQGGIP